MEELLYKLTVKMSEEIDYSIFYRDKSNGGIFDYIHSIINDPKYLSTCDIRNTTIHSIVDLYIIVFGKKLNSYQLHQCMDFLNSEDQDNLIIGMNMLYNLEIKEI